MRLTFCRRCYRRLPAAWPYGKYFVVVFTLLRSALYQSLLWLQSPCGLSRAGAASANNRVSRSQPLCYMLFSRCTLHLRCAERGAFLDQARLICTLLWLGRALEMSHSGYRLVQEHHQGICSCTYFYFLRFARKNKIKKSCYSWYCSFDQRKYFETKKIFC